jgi:L-asparaginase II
MEALPGWLAKRGAEGVLCLLAPDGTGVALKIEDGATRAYRPALARIVRDLGVEPPGDFARVPLENSRGEVVGEITAG